METRHQLLIAVCALVIGLGFLAHVDYLSRATFVDGADETTSEVCANLVRTQGLAEYIRQASYMAVGQGRVQYLFSWSLFIAPYFTNTDLERGLLCAGVHLLSWVFLVWFLVYYTGKTDAWVLLAFLYCLLPYLRGYWPLASYPLLDHTSILLFFLGAGMYLRNRKATPGWRRLAAMALALVALFFGVMVYENLTIAFCAILAASLWHETAPLRPNGWRRRLGAILRSDWPVLAVLALFAVLYVAFRLRFHSGYSGTQMSFPGAARLRAAWQVIRLFALLSAPAVNFVLRLGGIANYWVAHPKLAEIVPFVAGNLTLTGFLKATLGGVGLYLFGRGRGGQPVAHRFGPDVVIPVLAFLLGFVVQVPLALTPKYQQFAVDLAPYITGYFSFVCFTVAGWGVLRLLAKALAGRSRLAGSLAFGGLAALFFLAAGMNSIANEGQIRKHEQQYLRWKLMNAFLKADVFGNLPDSAVIVAPGLSEGIGDSNWQSKGDYWTQYVAEHTGRTIVVADRVPTIARSLIATGRLYCAQLQNTWDGGQALLLLSRITAIDEAALGQGLLSDTVVLIGDRDYHDAAISMLLSGKGPAYASSSGGVFQIGPLRHLPLPPFRLENGAYVTQVHQPGMVAGTWRLTAANLLPIERPLFEATLGDGFSYLETEGDRYWAWSDGPAGAAILRLVNHTDAPRVVHFEARILTGSEAPAPVDLVIQGKAETVMLRNKEKFQRELTLLPGSNDIRIHCHGPRIVAPGDPRYLVFGVEDWTITPVR